MKLRRYLVLAGIAGLLLAGLPAARVDGLWRHLPPDDELIEISGRLEPRYKPFVVRMAAVHALRSGELDTALVRCADCLRLVQRQAAWHDVPYAILLLSLVAVRRGDLLEPKHLRRSIPVVDDCSHGLSDLWYQFDLSGRISVPRIVKSVPG